MMVRLPNSNFGSDGGDEAPAFATLSSPKCLASKFCGGASASAKQFYKDATNICACRRRLNHIGSMIDMARDKP